MNCAWLFEDIVTAPVWQIPNKWHILKIHYAYFHNNSVDTDNALAMTIGDRHFRFASATLLKRKYTQNVRRMKTYTQLLDVISSCRLRWVAPLKCI